jgi:hypothetical protein
MDHLEWEEACLEQVEVAHQAKKMERMMQTPPLFLWLLTLKRGDISKKG